MMVATEKVLTKVPVITSMHIGSLFFLNAVLFTVNAPSKMIGGSNMFINIKSMRKQNR
jgi:hypothetical protein